MKRPRQYAAEIIRLPDAERAAALERVPSEHRAVVEHYLRDWPIRFAASIQASAKLIRLLPRVDRLARLREMPLYRRRRVLEAIDAMKHYGA